MKTNKRNKAQSITIFFRGLIKYLAHNHPHITTNITLKYFPSKVIVVPQSGNLFEILDKK